MKLFCNHYYQEDSRSFLPSAKSFSGEMMPGYLVEKLLYGETQILNKCIKCGKLQIVKLSGIVKKEIKL